MTDYPAVLSALYPDAEWSLNGDTYDGLTWLSEGDAPSKEMLDDAWPQVQFDREYASVQGERRARYAVETDGMFFAAQREGGDLSVWEAAVAAIKVDLPYPIPPAE